jgi:8-oxo-dGTP diphosphatase
MASKEGQHTYKWPRPALTVDTAIVVRPGPGAGPAAPPELLLIQRKHPPCKGQWALPGGFVDEVCRLPGRAR